MLKNKSSEELMEKINYRFKNEGYLKEALTHRSFSNENDKTKITKEEKKVRIANQQQ